MQSDAPRKLNKANQLSMPQLPNIFTPSQQNAMSMQYAYFPGNYTSTNSGSQVQMMPVQMMPIVNSSSPFQLAGQQVLDKSSNNNNNLSDNSNINNTTQPVLFLQMPQQNQLQPEIQQQQQQVDFASYPSPNINNNRSAVYQQHNTGAQQQQFQMNTTDEEQARIGTHSTNYLNKSKSQVVKENDLKNQYKTILQQQMKQKEQEKQLQKQNEKQLELNQIMDRQNNDWFGRQGCGAPLRDPQGNVRTTRKNPHNPNYQMQQWLNTNGNNQQQASAYLQAPVLQPQPQQQFYQSIQQIPTQSSQQQEVDNANSQYFPQQQLQQQQQLQPQQQQQQYNENSNNNNAHRLSQFFNNGQSTLMAQQQLPLQGSPQMPVYLPEMDAEQSRKRQLAQQVQKEQMEQIEMRRLKKEQEKLDQKRQRDLEDLKLQREKAENEQKMLLEYADRQLQNRNLMETNFDQKDLKKLYIARNQAPEVYDLDSKTKKQRNRRRPTPLEELGKRSENGQRGDIIIEQRIIKELPIEITKSVKDTVNQQLLKLRNELNFTSNHLGEQLLNIKGQVMKATHQHNRIDEDIKNISQDIRKTQEINEIRQREIYNAFVKNNDNYLLHQTEKIIEPEQVQMSKRVPDTYKYLMYDDPYNSGAKGIESDQARHAADDLCGILKQDSRIITLLPLDPSKNNMPNPNIYQQQQQLDQNLLQQSKNFNHSIDVGDAITDYREWDQGYNNKHNKQIDDTNVHVIGYDNKDRLDKLIEIDEHQQRGNYDEADKALYDLVTQNKNKKAVFNSKRRDSDQYNLKELDEFVSFQSKQQRFQ